MTCFVFEWLPPSLCIPFGKACRKNKASSEESVDEKTVNESWARANLRREKVTKIRGLQINPSDPLCYCTVSFSPELQMLFNIFFSFTSNSVPSVSGAYLVPYFILLLLIGIPLFFLELAVGQRIRRGSIGVWNYVYPQLGGIGVSSLMVSAWWWSSVLFFSPSKQPLYCFSKLLHKVVLPGTRYCCGNN